MIRHIFKIIWNERNANTWIVLEYVLVFCILWFCCDYLYYIGKSYYEPLGFDIINTYSVRMTQKKPSDPEADWLIRGEERDDEYAYALELLERLKQYPGVESACISSASMPYSGSTMAMGFNVNNDSISQPFRTRCVSSEFFDVFRIKLQNGRFFDWTDPAQENYILITPDRNGYFGDPKKSSYPVSDVFKIGHKDEEESPYTIIGVTKKLKSNFFSPYENTIFAPMEKWRISMRNDYTIRVHPNAAKGFEDRFIKDMRNKLIIGPYEFSNITSLKKMEESATKWSGITNNLNSVYSITLFLIINIFLGIIGTFWYRTESRVSEIGLRIALGASKRRLKTLLYTETIILLFISAVIGFNICVNIGQTDLLNALGIPRANAEQIGSGIEQYFINFGLTFLFLAIISLLAVWYPARQASNLQPAEALHEE